MKEKIIDDFAGMMGGALGILAEMRDQVRGDMRERLRHAADRIDLVTREEITSLESRIEALEALLAQQPKKAAKPAASTKTKTKPAAKKKAKK